MTTLRVAAAQVVSRNDCSPVYGYIFWLFLPLCLHSNSVCRHAKPQKRRYQRFEQGPSAVACDSSLTTCRKAALRTHAATRLPVMMLRNWSRWVCARAVCMALGFQRFRCARQCWTARRVNSSWWRTVQRQIEKSQSSSMVSIGSDRQSTQARGPADQTLQKLDMPLEPSNRRILLTVPWVGKPASESSFFRSGRGRYGMNKCRRGRAERIARC